MSDKKILSMNTVEKEEKKTVASAMDAFLSSNGKILLCVVAIAIVVQGK